MAPVRMASGIAGLRRLMMAGRRLVLEGVARKGVAVRARGRIGLPSRAREAGRAPCEAIQKGTRVLISLWDSLMFGRVPNVMEARAAARVSDDMW